MNGFLHYFLSALDPMSNFRVFASVPEADDFSSTVLVVRGRASRCFGRGARSHRMAGVCCEACPGASAATCAAKASGTFGVRGYRGAKRVRPPSGSAFGGRCYAAIRTSNSYSSTTTRPMTVSLSRGGPRSASPAAGMTRSACRIFPSPRRNGKASSLNIGIRMARGEFIVIHDADLIIQYGAVQHWLLPFTDPRVGGVAANIRVDNSTVNLLTRLQEVEYAMKFTLAKFFQSKISLMDIISGMGGIFRGEIIRRLGGLTPNSAMIETCRPCCSSNALNWRSQTTQSFGRRFQRHDIIFGASECDGVGT